MAGGLHYGHGVVEENVLELNSIAAEDLVARLQARPASYAVILGKLHEDPRLPFRAFADSERVEDRLIKFCFEKGLIKLIPYPNPSFSLGPNARVTIMSLH